MKLEGSCHCGAVKFSVASRHPYPFNRCYCSICRKTDGGGGYAINLGADAETLQITGEEHITVYQVTLQEGETRAKRVRRSAGSAAIAEARSGSGIPAGLIICILLHPPLIRSCRRRRRPPI